MPINTETIEISYEDVTVLSDTTNMESNASANPEDAIDLDYKLYKNRYKLDKKDNNIIPTIKLRKLDDRIYRGNQNKASSLIKDFEKHKIRPFTFASLK